MNYRVILCMKISKRRMKKDSLESLFLRKFLRKMYNTYRYTFINHNKEMYTIIHFQVQFSYKLILNN